ncbi:c-type cytochrome biogenesis protein CcsB [Paenibacillus sp. TRM 82003]|uniref:c-type cytochrome biogenesis protein CcsB n=1 Tax=Kineococcus sp. TRM81007 TaxID=2925831 RepID=UPI001F564147|nr:c-type cytochrome biogenesis protein CcsB [Kineococcus sp. TRM81007]MCI2238861.1 c-type cytochrome biogenesis protein CcsB [Kineococcus sp. TRM81007]MCI3924266.1 c-type cytochrome biogenesis protein CcsB [Paenibacillus sp. TRM 82003]
MTVDENVAQVSNLLLYSAMTAYLGSFIAYAADLAEGGKEIKARDARRRGSAEATAAGTTASTAAAGAVLTEAPAPPPRRRRAAAVGTSLFAASTLLLAGSVTARALSVHRVPWGNMFEFALTGCLVVSIGYLVAVVRASRAGLGGGRDARYLGTFVAGPVLATLGIALRSFYVEAAQLVPALDSYWLVIHVFVAILATALSTLGFSATVLQLVQEKRERVRAGGGHPGGAFMDALPGSAELERTAFRLNAVAFVMWTFTLIAGAVWAQVAWNRYWNWDSKEVWTFIIWVVYACYLHARATRGWDGRRAAWLSVLAFGCVLFNYLVVNIFFPGLHSYAGV